MHGWAIPQDNRMVHQTWGDKNCFDLPNNANILHFGK